MIRTLTLLLLFGALFAEDDLVSIETPKNYVQVYAVSGYRVVDGDTIKVRLELGHGLSKVVSLRLIGIDTPETNRTNQKVAGLLVEQVVNQWMASQRHLLCDYHSDDKYAGRIDGGTRDDWTAEQLQAITIAASELITQPAETP